MRIIGLALAVSLATIAPLAEANPVDSRTAKKMLFGTSSDVILDREEYLDPAIGKALKQAGASIPYFGAIAVSPGEPTS